MYQKILLELSRHAAFKKLMMACPLTRAVVRRFVPGESWAGARPAIADLIDRGLTVAVDYLGEDTEDENQAETMVGNYLAILDHIAKEGWAGSAEVSVKLSAIGLRLADGENIARANLTRLAERAQAVGSMVTVDMEDCSVTDKTIRVVTAVRRTYPDLGLVLQAQLRRTEIDCAEVDAPGARVRLCKGSYDSPDAVAYPSKHEVDLSYVRSLKILMEGAGRPLVATHDPIMIEIAQELAAHSNRGPKDFEFQMLYGVRPVEQSRLADLGHPVRVYLPFGTDWYRYLVRRLAERPGNLVFFLNALLPSR